MSKIAGRLEFRYFFSFVLLCVVLCSPWRVSLAQTRFPVSRHRVLHFIMDHTQGREFHHHLARAIMHLNYLAGLLPFFEPSIEWDDPPSEAFLVLGVQIQPHELFIHLFLCLPLPPHRQWPHGIESRTTSSSTYHYQPPARG